MPDSTVQELALVLASAIWDEDALHVELTHTEKTSLDRIAKRLLVALGHAVETEIAPAIDTRIELAHAYLLSHSD